MFNQGEAMKHMFVLISALMFVLPMTGHADDDFYGKVESRPDDKVGTWVIDGRNLDVTSATRLKEKISPLVAGTCVEVEIDEGIVQEIETVKMSKCE
jgi:hypothetical protein